MISRRAPCTSPPAKKSIAILKAIFDVHLSRIYSINYTFEYISHPGSLCRLYLSKCSWRRAIPWRARLASPAGLLNIYGGSFFCPFLCPLFTASKSYETEFSSPETGGTFDLITIYICPVRLLTTLCLFLTPSAFLARHLPCADDHHKTLKSRP